MTDNYGRDVSVTTIGVKDIYTVSDGVSVTYFELSFTTGTDVDVVMKAINKMAPPDFDFDPGYLLDKPNYIGGIEISMDTSGPVTLTLPVDLTNGETVKYSYGQNKLNLYLNGQHLLLGEDYIEVGPGPESDQVQILQDLVDEDYIEFQIK